MKQADDLNSHQLDSYNSFQRHIPKNLLDDSYYGGLIDNMTTHNLNDYESINGWKRAPSNLYGYSNFDTGPDVIGACSNQASYETNLNNPFPNQYLTRSPLDHPVQYHSEGSPDSRFSYHRTANPNAYLHKTLMKGNVLLHHSDYKDESEVPVKYCIECTPDVFSKGSSLSSLSIINSEDNEGLNQKVLDLLGIKSNVLDAILSNPNCYDQIESAHPPPSNQAIDQQRNDVYNPVAYFKHPDSLLTSTPNSKQVNNNLSTQNKDDDEEEDVNITPEHYILSSSGSDEDSSCDFIDLGMPKSKEVDAKRKSCQVSSVNQAREICYSFSDREVATASRNESSFFCDTEANNTVIHNKEAEDVEAEESLLVEEAGEDNKNLCKSSEHFENIKAEKESFPNEEMADDDYMEVNKLADAITDLCDDNSPQFEIMHKVKTKLHNSIVIPDITSSKSNSFTPEKKSSKFNVLIKQFRNSMKIKKKK